MYAVIGILVAQDGACGVSGAVSCLADEFRTAVAVEVIDHKLGVVGASANVASKVNSPKPLAAEFQAIDEYGSGIAVVGVVVGVAGIPLEEKLIFPVPVGVSKRAVPGRVAGCLAVRHNLVGRSFYRDVEIRLDGVFGKGESSCGKLSAYRLHFIDYILVRGVLVDEPGPVADGLGIDFSSVAIDVKGKV